MFISVSSSLLAFLFVKVTDAKCTSIKLTILLTVTLLLANIADHHDLAITKKWKSESCHRFAQAFVQFIVTFVN